MLKPFSTFLEAQKYLYNLAANVTELKFSGKQDYIEKQSELMKLLGNPELELKVIHIAGTSGKGSTATILADALISQKFKVGSSFSPHITDICERIQINGAAVSRRKFLEYFNEILPALSQRIEQKQAPSYYETLTALQLYIFAKEKVDYAVLEVGCGGRLDATNIFIPNKICIINSIGLDHVAILGDTLLKIAGEKAGIIQEGNQVIALSQSLEINEVFVNRAKEMKANLDFVIPDFCFENIKLYENKTYFSYIDQDLLDRQIALGMLGKYQAVNASLALRAVETLAERDNWNIDWDRLKYQLQSTKLIGRFEVIELNKLPLDKGLSAKLTGVSLVEDANKDLKQSTKTLILDGAHNPQKMQAFIASLKEYYPDRKFDLLLAFKKGKDVNQMLDEILKYKDRINKIILTRFDELQDTQIESQSLGEIENYLILNKFENFETVQNLEQAYDLLKQNFETISVITGSLYLISAIKSLDQKPSLDLN
jgi:dihydrofolate synthase / folylpolyglutamate synthase